MEKARPQAEALALALKEPVNPLSLYRIETELVELGQLLGDALERRETLEFGVDTDAVAQMDAEIQTAELAIRQYVTAERSKVDSIAGFIRYLTSSQERVKAEETRLYEYRKRLEALQERVKAAALYALQATHQKRLEGGYSRIRRQANPVSVEITNRQVIPRSYQQVHIRMNSSEWQTIIEVCPWLEGKFEYDGEATLMLEAIKTVLLQQEKAQTGEGDQCVRQGVPGARLNRTKEHLRVE